MNTDSYIHITEEQYQRLRKAEREGTHILSFEVIEDVFEMSDFCYKNDGDDGWLIEKGAYGFAERNNFVWEDRE